MFTWHLIILQTCIILFCHTSLYLGAMITKSAYIVAAQTGATQFQEYAVSVKNNSKENQPKGSLQFTKNPAHIHENDDIYQGVVGRPGIDFPILTKIPLTNFDCVQYGNGYFADLDTKCQVFHICDEGKKISFLCPNGTIFRQLDLICDWWFKVDCTAALNHYAESSEMLTNAQRARLQSKYPVPQPIKSPEQFSLNIQRKHALLNNPGPNLNALAINRRMDTNVEDSFENIDLEDITFKRNNVRRSDAGSGNREEFSEEVQTADETASFLTGDRKQRGYNYPAPEKVFNNPELKPAKFITWKGQATDASPRTPKKLDNDNVKKSESRNAIPFATRITTPTTTVASIAARQHTLKATTVSTVSRGSTTHQTSTLNQKFEQKAFLDPGTKQKSPVSSTPSNMNGYTTARKPITKSKDKPYYTPTIPTITNKAEQTTSITPTSLLPSGDAAEHAMEMMKTLQNLDLPEPMQDLRTGIEVPPSSGPNVLHSLALYFANDSGNTSTTVGPITMKTDEFPVINKHHTVSSSLLSRRTIDKYIQLFGGQTSRPSMESFEYEARINDESGNDLEGQYSRHPLFGEFESLQVRELAQVFTHALSAYLQDPDSFRRILSEIRPKAPSKIIISNHLDNRLTKDDEISMRRASLLTARLQITPVPGSEMMNNQEVLDFSDVTLPTTVKRETTAFGIEVTTEMPKNKALSKKTPASKYITNNLEKAAAAYRERQKHNSKSSVDFKNELAHEVNEELGTLKPPMFRTGLNVENFDEKIESNGKLQAQEISEKRSNTISITDSKLSKSDAPSVQVLRDGETTTSTEPSPTVYFELLPPRNEHSANINKEFLHHDHDDLLEDDEQLQRAQSQSIVSSQNQGYTNIKKSKSKISNTNKNNSDASKYQNIKKGYYITKQSPQEINVATEASKSSTPSSTSKTTVSYTVFLDPLTINDGLMNLIL